MKLSNGAREIALATLNGWAIEPMGVEKHDCETHGAFESIGQRVGWYDGGAKELWSKCPTCMAEYEEDKRKEKEEREAEAHAADRRANLAAAGIPSRFAERTLANFKAADKPQQNAAEIARDFIENFQTYRKAGASLVFSGRPGTGKSHLALAILQGIMPRYIGRYVTCMDVIREVRSTWRKDSEKGEAQILQDLCNQPLLVIDEIGMQYGSDGEQTILFDVLDLRYREMRPTILITNQDKDGFKTYVGERIFDRLTESARWVPFAWESYRKVARKEQE
jgi:DNA replication protein DnaC